MFGDPDLEHKFPTFLEAGSYTPFIKLK